MNVCFECGGSIDGHSPRCKFYRLSIHEMVKRLDTTYLTIIEAIADTGLKGRQNSLGERVWTVSEFRRICEAAGIEEEVPSDAE